jgi:hypothetical protein
MALDIECCYAEYHVVLSIMLTVIMLSIVMLNVVASVSATSNVSKLTRFPPAKKILELNKTRQLRDGILEPSIEDALAFSIATLGITTLGTTILSIMGIIVTIIILILGITTLCAYSKCSLRWFSLCWVS